jgi:hypothetical protein
LASALCEFHFLSGVAALRKVAIGIKVLLESDDVNILELPTIVELTQKMKNLNAMRNFSTLLRNFVPVQGATPFYDTDIMNLPLVELKEMPRAAHALFPHMPRVGMSGTSVGGRQHDGE